MAEHLPLAGFDTSIFIAGLVKRGLPPERNVCPIILDHARQHAFRVLVLEEVVAELYEFLEREFPDRADDFKAEADDLIGRCLTVRPPAVPPEELLAKDRQFLALTRDPDDVHIAIALSKSPPDFFVTTNTDHFRSVCPVAGVRRLCKPHEFCNELGIRIPRRFEPTPT